jgi:hypothetical protein
MVVGPCGADLIAFTFLQCILMCHTLSMINNKSNAVHFQRVIIHWWSNETVCSHDLNSVMTDYFSHLPEDRCKTYFHIICVSSIKYRQWMKLKVLYSRTHVQDSFGCRTGFLYLKFRKISKGCLC